MEGGSKGAREGSRDKGRDGKREGGKMMERDTERRDIILTCSYSQVQRSNKTALCVNNGCPSGVFLRFLETCLLDHLMCALIMCSTQ